MNNQNLTVGTRIHYTGDMANADGNGTITSARKGWYPMEYRIAMDDGREFETILPAYFAPGPGRRFMTLDEHRQERRDSYEAMLDSLGRTDAEKAEALATFDTNWAEAA